MPKHENAAPDARVSARWLRNFSAIAPLLLACAGDVINLGENDRELSPQRGSRCQSSTTIEGSVVIENQEQLDALEGCEVVAGDLAIKAFPAATLRPLYALNRVEGDLSLGRPSILPKDGLSQDDRVAQLNAYAESVRDWLQSMEGLERLEVVDALTIIAPVSSLRPLSRLRHVTTLTVSSDELEDLAGLEALRGVSSLDAAGSKLRDMSALRLPETMSDLSLGGAIEVLNAGELKYLSSLTVSGTALEALDAFQNLEVVGHLVIRNNDKLQNLDALVNLSSIDQFVVAENDALQRLGGFPSLGNINSIEIDDNDNLSELSSFPNLGESGRTDALTLLTVPRNLESILIRKNGSLRHLTLPEAWKGADFVRIMGNFALEDIDFVNLAAVGTLTITRNEALTHVNLGALSAVATLQVANNPLLPPADFDGVRTFESELSGNAAAP